MAVPLAGLTFVIVSAIVRQLRGQPVEGLVEPRKPWAPVHWRLSMRHGRSATSEEAKPREAAAS